MMAIKVLFLRGYGSGGKRSTFDVQRSTFNVERFFFSPTLALSPASRLFADSPRRGAVAEIPIAIECLMKKVSGKRVHRIFAKQ